MAKTRLAVLFGGKSGEHEISCISATSVIRAVDKEKYDIITIGITKAGEWLLYEGPVDNIESGAWEKIARAELAEDPGHFALTILGTGGKGLKDICDFVFPVLHGPNGEDGTVQGVLQLLDIPYAASGVLGCALTMDKIAAKDVFKSAGIKQVPYVALNSSEIGPAKIAEINETLKYPLFVKPANMGSSVGITKVNDPANLIKALNIAAMYDTRIVVEQGVNARELETAVMGNLEPIAGAVGEIITEAEFYDYDAKYHSSTSRTVVPAEISAQLADEIRAEAIKAYLACCCSGFARVDFLVDKDSQEIYLNEINAIPGFTKISMFPMLFMATGLTYTQIVEKIIEFGYERYNAENKK